MSWYCDHDRASGARVAPVLPSRRRRRRANGARLDWSQRPHTTSSGCSCSCCRANRPPPRLRASRGWAAGRRSALPRVGWQRPARRSPNHGLPTGAPAHHPQWVKRRSAAPGQTQRARKRGDVRTAGSLVLLYGLPVTRLVGLTRSQPRTDSTGEYLVITGNPVLIPPRVAALLAAVPTSPNVGALTGTPNPEPWLFPGRLPARPPNAHGLRRSLHERGVAVRNARNAALIALAGDLPPAVLSDLLGSASPPQSHGLAAAHPGDQRWETDVRLVNPGSPGETRSGQAQVRGRSRFPVSSCRFPGSSFVLLRDHLVVTRRTR